VNIKPVTAVIIASTTYTSDIDQASNMPDDESLSTSSASDELDWKEDEDGGDDGDVESITVVSLLDDSVFPDVISMITYCKEKHNFDFLGIRSRLALDFLGTVKLINFGL
jgi:protein arginine N-methyltransferase 3